MENDKEERVLCTCLACVLELEAQTLFSEEKKIKFASTLIQTCQLLSNQIELHVLE